MNAKERVTKRLSHVVEDITDLKWIRAGDVKQSTEAIITPLSFEPLFHELVHWMIASDLERRSHNLALVNHASEEIEIDGESQMAGTKWFNNSKRREKQAMFWQYEIASELGWKPKVWKHLTDNVITAPPEWYNNLSPNQIGGYRSFVTKKITQQFKESTINKLKKLCKKRFNLIPESVKEGYKLGVN